MDRPVALSPAPFNEPGSPDGPPSKRSSSNSRSISPRTRGSATRGAAMSPKDDVVEPMEEVAHEVNALVEIRRLTNAKKINPEKRLECQKLFRQLCLEGSPHVFSRNFKSVISSITKAVEKTLLPVARTTTTFVLGIPNSLDTITYSIHNVIAIPRSTKLKNDFQNESFNGVIQFPLFVGEGFFRTHCRAVELLAMHLNDDRKFDLSKETPETIDYLMSLMNQYGCVFYDSSPNRDVIINHCKLERSRQTKDQFFVILNVCESYLSKIFNNAEFKLLSHRITIFIYEENSVTQTKLQIEYPISPETMRFFELYRSKIHKVEFIRGVLPHLAMPSPFFIRDLLRSHPELYDLDITNYDFLSEEDLEAIKSSNVVGLGVSCRQCINNLEALLTRQAIRIDFLLFSSMCPMEKRALLNSFERIQSELTSEDRVSLYGLEGINKEDLLEICKIPMRQLYLGNVEFISDDIIVHLAEVNKGLQILTLSPHCQVTDLSLLAQQRTSLCIHPTSIGAESRSRVRIQPRLLEASFAFSWSRGFINSLNSELEDLIVSYGSIYFDEYYLAFLNYLCNSRTPSPKFSFAVDALNPIPTALFARCCEKIAREGLVLRFPALSYCLLIKNIHHDSSLDHGMVIFDQLTSLMLAEPDRFSPTPVLENAFSLISRTTQSKSHAFSYYMDFARKTGCLFEVKSIGDAMHSLDTKDLVPYFDLILAHQPGGKVNRREEIFLFSIPDINAFIIKVFKFLSPEQRQLLYGLIVREKEVLAFENMLKMSISTEKEIDFQHPDFKDISPEMQQVFHKNWKLFQNLSLTTLSLLERSLDQPAILPKNLDLMSWLSVLDVSFSKNYSKINPNLALRFLKIYYSHAVLASPYSEPESKNKICFIFNTIKNHPNAVQELGEMWKLAKDKKDDSIIKSILFFFANLDESEIEAFAEVASDVFLSCISILQLDFNLLFELLKKLGKNLKITKTFFLFSSVVKMLSFYFHNPQYIAEQPLFVEKLLTFHSRCMHIVPNKEVFVEQGKYLYKKVLECGFVPSCEFLADPEIYGKAIQALLMKPNNVSSSVEAVSILLKSPQAVNYKKQLLAILNMAIGLKLKVAIGPDFANELLQIFTANDMLLEMYPNAAAFLVEDYLFRNPVGPFADVIDLAKKLMANQTIFPNHLEGIRHVPRAELERSGLLEECACSSDIATLSTIWDTYNEFYSDISQPPVFNTRCFWELLVLLSAEKIDKHPIVVKTFFKNHGGQYLEDGLVFFENLDSYNHSLSLSALFIAFGYFEFASKDSSPKSCLVILRKYILNPNFSTSIRLDKVPPFDDPKMDQFFCDLLEIAIESLNDPLTYCPTFYHSIVVAILNKNMCPEPLIRMICHPNFIDKHEGKHKQKLSDLKNPDTRMVINDLRVVKIIEEIYQKFGDAVGQRFFAGVSPDIQELLLDRRETFDIADFDEHVPIVKLEPLELTEEMKKRDLRQLLTFMKGAKTNFEKKLEQIINREPALAVPPENERGWFFDVVSSHLAHILDLSIKMKEEKHPHLTFQEFIALDPLPHLDVLNQLTCCVSWIPIITGCYFTLGDPPIALETTVEEKFIGIAFNLKLVCLNAAIGACTQPIKVIRLANGQNFVDTDFEDYHTRLSLKKKVHEKGYKISHDPETRNRDGLPRKISEERVQEVLARTKEIYGPREVLDEFAVHLSSFDFERLHGWLTHQFGEIEFYNPDYTLKRSVLRLILQKVRNYRGPVDRMEVDGQ